MFLTVSLALSGILLWWLLSGIFKPLLLGLGLVSVLLVVAAAHRMQIVDREGHPVHLLLRAVRYWIWLAREIVKSNLDVVRVILDPALPISPVVFRAKASQRTELGIAIYANSITLTPGTLTTWLEGDEIEVHALTREMARDVLSGEMDRRVTHLEGDEWCLSPPH